MSVPEEIRKVERPRNTVVVDTGNEGVLRYAVRERGNTVYVPGRNPQPRNGRIIGHIIDGKFIERKNKAAEDGPSFLSYGSSRLIRELSHDILDDLLKVYRADTAIRILIIAAMRIIRPGIPLRKIQERYSRTFFCHWYPNLPLSENTISTLLKEVGEDMEKRKEFYRLRIEAVAREHHIAIDGTLKEDTSEVNDISGFSHKSRIRGCRDISVIYAYDIERKEPICAEVFRGNFIDATSYCSFIRDNSIESGIIVADKGFPPSKIEKELEKRPNLHFLTPIKRNDTRIANNGMLEWEDTLDGAAGNILCCKKRIKSGRFLYSFKDLNKSHGEENSFIDRLKKNGKEFSLAEYGRRSELSGVIVFESDLDESPMTIYQCYEQRWMLELVFRSYKNDEALYKTRVQGDFSVIGNEFVNFISTLITARIINRMEKTDILRNITYGDLMEDLTDSWRIVGSEEPAHSEDGCWMNVSEGVFPELEVLGLSIAIPRPEPKKRGRPRLRPLPDPNAPKKKRGRPSKKQT